MINDALAAPSATYLGLCVPWEFNFGLELRDEDGMRLIIMGVQSLDVN